MTILTGEGRRVEFATSEPSDLQVRAENVYNLARTLPEKVKDKLKALPCFQGADTMELCEEAMKIAKGKHISDRFTAMVVIVGARSLDNPALQVPRTQVEIGAPRYAR